ncbi:hypothetical protein MKW92_031188 [Papaver armeniacum]|nr:hypothetical protein MKW92_031188 [Papaver armeniacum]
MGSKKTTDLEALAERLQEQGFSSLSTLDLKIWFLVVLGGDKSSSSNRAPGKRKAEDSVLRSTDGYFKNGVLNVKHLLHNNSSRSMENRPSRPQALNFGTGTSDKGKKKQGGGKKKGGRKHGKKRH